MKSQLDESVNDHTLQALFDQHLLVSTRDIHEAYSAFAKKYTISTSQRLSTNRLHFLQYSSIITHFHQTYMRYFNNTKTNAVLAYCAVIIIIICSLAVTVPKAQAVVLAQNIKGSLQTNHVATEYTKMTNQIDLGSFDTFHVLTHARRLTREQVTQALRFPTTSEETNVTITEQDDGKPNIVEYGVAPANPLEGMDHVVEFLGIRNADVETIYGVDSEAKVVFIATVASNYNKK